MVSNRSSRPKVVLAYSGGLDTTVIIPWLVECYEYDVIAFVADVGQGVMDLQGINDRAITSGASQCVVQDLQKEFVLEYVWPCLRAGAIYEKRYLLGTVMSRPIIAKHQIRLAHDVGAVAVAHGSTSKGNDQVRFELSYMALDPQIRIIAPWKDSLWHIKSRMDALQYAKKRGIKLVGINEESLYSLDRNLWHTSCEGGPLEKLENNPYDLNALESSNIKRSITDKTFIIKIYFDAGNPVRLVTDNEDLAEPVSILKTLNIIGSRSGIGIVDMVENRFIGIKSRGVYDTPGGTILHYAHDLLESVTLDKETMHYKQIMSLKYAEIVYNGLWFTPLRLSMDKFFDHTQRTVNGCVTLAVAAHGLKVLNIESPNCLYENQLASFNTADYDNQSAQGFLDLYGLPLRRWAMVNADIY